MSCNPTSNHVSVPVFGPEAWLQAKLEEGMPGMQGAHSIAKFEKLLRPFLYDSSVELRQSADTNTSSICKHGTDSKSLQEAETR